jgi:hypothetical protein
MTIKNYIEKCKPDLFQNRSVIERYRNFIDVTNALLAKTKTITQEDSDALTTMALDENFEKEHPINQYLSFMSNAWISELFNVKVMPKQENLTEEDDEEYDPVMLELAGEHPHLN